MEIPEKMTKPEEVKIGVLIIGSLYWDDLTHRDKWRRARLCLDAKRHVRAPIRYGRRSGSRGCSYTMVFSLSLVPDKLGRAIVVPCCRTVRSASDLVDEAVHLWTAETSYGKNPKCRISAMNGWGCVALLENPDHPMSDELRACWTNRVSRELCYGQLLNSAVGEEVVVDKSGFLNIPWPSSEDGSDLGVDALLATATNPTFVDGDHYPSPCQVANAWNTHDGKDYIDYFCKNRAHGIKTFQDTEIEDRLRELWQ